MEAPLGMNSDVYLGLQEQLATKTRVCVYDRAGVGLSDRPVQPLVNMSSTSGENSAAATAKIRRLRGHEFTVERMVDDLHRLITSSSNLGRPLMLVGSDMGAMIARFYTQLYSE